MVEESQDYDEFYDHPFVIDQIDPNRPLHPSTKALISLRFEGPPHEVALKYKDEGNYLFSKANYKTAIDNYREAIKTHDEDNILLRQLYTNIGLCHLKLSNPKRASESFTKSLEHEFHPKPLKLLITSLLSQSQIDRAEEYAIKSLESFPSDQELIELRKRVEDNKVRAKAAKKQKEKIWQEKMEIAREIKRRNILVDGQRAGNLGLERIHKVTQPAHSFIDRVYLKDGSLRWPLAFTFAESGVTDFVVDFDERNLVQHMLDQIFVEAPKWDVEGNYSNETVEIYAQCDDNSKLWEVGRDSSLEGLLNEGKAHVVEGVVAFLLLSKSAVSGAIKRDYLILK